MNQRILAVVLVVSFCIARPAAGASANLALGVSTLGQDVVRQTANQANEVQDFLAGRVQNSQSLNLQTQANLNANARALENNIALVQQQATRAGVNISNCVNIAIPNLRLIRNLTDNIAKCVQTISINLIDAKVGEAVGVIYNVQAIANNCIRNPFTCLFSIFGGMLQTAQDLLSGVLNEVLQLVADANTCTTTMGNTINAMIISTGNNFQICVSAAFNSTANNGTGGNNGNPGNGGNNGNPGNGGNNGNPGNGGNNGNPGNGGNNGNPGNGGNNGNPGNGGTSGNPGNGGNNGNPGNGANTGNGNGGLGGNVGVSGNVGINGGP